MSVTLVAHEDCCGCGACNAVCPKGAIALKPDSLGFSYPEIDKNICIECGLCLNVCETTKSIEDILKNSFSQATYAAKNIDESVRVASTSGGAFSVFAEKVISDGGAVYGAMLRGNEVVHSRAVGRDYEKFRGSKYIQSNMTDIYRSVETDLMDGRQVLVTGTPCQIAAIKAYSKCKHYDISGLILCDIICHGVASPKIFKDYIDYCERKAKKKITVHTFRAKTNGWHAHTEINEMEDGTKDSESYESQLFRSVFYSDFALRESCFRCRFTCKERPSDITIADFWGIDKAMPEFDDNLGVSCVICNTQIGHDFFTACASMLNSKSADISMCKQPMLEHPTERKNGTDRFRHDYTENGFKYIACKYFGAGYLHQFLLKCYKKLLKRGR